MTLQSLGFVLITIECVREPIRKFTSRVCTHYLKKFILLSCIVTKHQDEPAAQPKHEKKENGDCAYYVKV